jgi:hypothetical protein
MFTCEKEKKEQMFFFQTKTIKKIKLRKKSGNLALEISLQFVWQTKLSGELFLHNLEKEREKKLPKFVVEVSSLIFFN